MLLLGAADIQHRTRNGTKRFKNVPFASLWLGSAIDSMLDVHRGRKSGLGSSGPSDEADQARISDAMLEDLDSIEEEGDDEDEDDGDDDE